MSTDMVNALAPALKAYLTKAAPKSGRVLQRKVYRLSVPTIQKVRADSIPWSNGSFVVASASLHVYAVNVIAKMIFASKPASAGWAVKTFIDFKMRFEMGYSRVEEAAEGTMLTHNRGRAIRHTQPHLWKVCCLVFLPIIFVLETLSAAQGARKGFVE